MDLSNLHLEEITLPKDYKEVITEQRELTPELKKENFRAGEWGSQARRYNFILIREEIEPFLIRIIERNVESPKFDGVIEYQLVFHVETPAFKPFFKFMKEWGKANCKKSNKINFYFCEWLGNNVESDYNPKDDGIYQAAPSNNDEVIFKVTNENSFFKLLKDISTCFRTLSAEHSSKSGDSAIEFEYDDSDLKGKDYWELANHILTPMVTRGVTAGINVFRENVNNGDTDETVISIEINGKKESMLFFYGDNCEGKPFFEFQLGKVLTKCVSLMKKSDLVYRQELSHWFSDGISDIPKKVYKGLEITIEVPEVGGDPYLENFE